VPSASLNSAFWSSTSSDRRSTTSSLQSVSTFRGGAAAFGKAVISRTSSVGPAAGLTMRGIQEEDAEFWQLLQHQQTTGDETERGAAMGIGRRSPSRLQVSLKASFSRSCPCLSLAAMRPERDGE